MAVDYNNDLLLITAASGKQATALLPHLAPRFKRLRLQCISDSSRKRLQEEYPNAEAIQSDFSDLTKAKTLLKGVATCYLITPAFHPREAQHGINMVDAATQNYRCGEGPFKHLIFSSVIHSSIRAMANHDNKRYVEEALVDADIPYTILQPTHIMDTTPIRMIAEQETPVFKARFDPRTEFSFVCTYDIGEAVAKIIMHREQHLYATYQLVSTSEPLNYVEAMGIVSQVIGKTVRIERLSVDEAVEGFRGLIAAGTPEQDSQALLSNAARMFVYYNRNGLKGNSNVLQMLLGRKPLEYREWVERQLK
ncbi:Hypothetical predicted protein [Lecanosticta acicola]|uniref:NmrA-like domain-containing protein n=1 Tax=Lecanosticta acicola TaxID=111012 RepID=A0AAI8Z1R3_9PEZI|nr:Hypothetical predicted protein [Lecanosticta acicola]